MEYFREMPIESWTCNKVCAYYKNDPRYKDKNTREILHEIRNDLKIFNEGKFYEPSLHEKATEILNNWKPYTRNLKRMDKRSKIRAKQDKLVKQLAKLDNDQAKLGNNQAELCSDQTKQDQRQDDISTYIDIEKIVNPILNCTDNLKSEFRTQIIKLYHYPDNDDWQFQYNTISIAKNLLEAEQHLNQAQQVLLGSSLSFNNQT